MPAAPNPVMVKAAPLCQVSLGAASAARTLRRKAGAVPQPFVLRGLADLFLRFYSSWTRDRWSSPYRRFTECWPASAGWKPLGTRSSSSGAGVH